jgi:hypothetical protein
MSGGAIGEMCSGRGGGRRGGARGRGRGPQAASNGSNRRGSH